MRDLIHKKIIYPAIERATGEPIKECLDYLQSSQWYSNEKLRAVQWIKIKKLIEHCYENSVFYNKKFKETGIKPGDIRGFEDMNKIPFLTKNDLRFLFNRILCENFSGKTEKCHSGGTYGKPVIILRDSISSAYARAAFLRCIGWYGLQYGDRQLRIWGAPLAAENKLKEKAKDFLLNRNRISAFNIDKSKAGKYYRMIMRYRPKYIYGYASAVFRLCRIFSEKKLDGKDLRIKYVVTTAEPLFKYQREFIENYLNAVLINEYGCSETGPIAQECPEGKMHINMENVFLEFIEMPGKKTKEIVITDLNSYSMPILRYKIGDTGSSEGAGCACGRRSDLFDFKAGRVVDSLLSVDGKYIAGNMFGYIAFELSQKYGGVKEYRITQTERKKIKVKISSDGTLSKKALDFMTDRIKEILGSEMEVKYQFVEEIPLEPSGKRIYVENKLLQKKEI